MLSSPAVLAALAVALVFLSISTVKVYLKSRNAASKNEEVKQEMAELERRRAEMEEEIGRLRSEFGREEELREKFNVQKPGENALTIVDRPEENGKMDSGEESRGFFSKIWQAIKNIF